MHVVLYISIRFQSCKALFETPCISYSLCTYSHHCTRLSVRQYAPSPEDGITVLGRTATFSTYAKLLCLTQTAT